MPAPSHILRPLALRYQARFAQAVPARLVRSVPLQKLVELIERSLRTGAPLA